MEETATNRPDAGSVADAVQHVDRCIASYADACRTRIPAFVASHFSLRQTWHLQRRTLARDLLVGPLNSLWAIPYLTLSRVCRGLDIVGVSGAMRVLKAVPAGIPTGYQRSVEQMIATDLLAWGNTGPSDGLPGALVDDLERHPGVRGNAAVGKVLSDDALRAVFEQFLSARALVVDVAGAAVTLALGWMAFDAPSLGLMGISEGFARRNARSRAASRFFLGRRAGSVFYSVFRPSAHPVETAIILGLLALGIGALAMACSLLFEPVRKAFGLHERRLHRLVDQIERELLVIAQRQIKPALAPAPVQHG
ncbi:MAG: DUF6635 family protein [Vicinamibacterales bacterium]